MCSNYENRKAIIWLGLLICRSYAHVLSISEKRMGLKTSVYVCVIVCVCVCVCDCVCDCVFPRISRQLLKVHWKKRIDCDRKSMYFRDSWSFLQSWKKHFLVIMWKNFSPKQEYKFDNIRSSSSQDWSTRYCFTEISQGSSWSSFKEFEICEEKWKWLKHRSTNNSLFDP